MATRPADLVQTNQPKWLIGSLSDASYSIGGAHFDALLFWGIPFLALFFTQVVAYGALLMGTANANQMIEILVAAISVLTFAHLIAVVPRAYLNREVFSAYRTRLTLMPLVLIVALLSSPLLLIAAGVLTFFWDVHHSALQTFGLARIYDMKAGNKVEVLRNTDLRLNWLLYVGPIAAGASFLVHIQSLEMFDKTALQALVLVPGFLAQFTSWISAGAILAVLFVLGWAIIDYRAAIATGYQMPIHKLVLMASTGLVSILAWGLAPPIIAFAAINLFHALQYFALVWLKEGERMTVAAKSSPKAVFCGFTGLCAIFGIAYFVATKQSYQLLLAPFIACSLLHFWFDSFVWSVRKKQV
jgi:hypothetical protein